MRTVFVFPAAGLDETVGTLDRHLPGRRLPWVMEGCLYIELEVEGTDHLFTDWEPGAVAALDAALGYHPSWGLQVDVSGRVDGTAEVHRMAALLLRGGGVAVDDYSDHPWTPREIADGAVVGGLRFFDFRANGGRDGPRP
ncbi:hypothetical protein SAMN05421803_105217 [Nocardiopsis flavescens]|uniref:Uncharacterized protein n=1 Tax=Nocardiopsis flavescens TaxID=758803 RepID=A0A1M6ILU6_9ACTN|nr:hypothetical protein [Nocardiopsis flavescens]SHJ35420.1 hypothetical protein SAMN05421803_105217 [Nocardiopsis flavescens]